MQAGSGRRPLKSLNTHTLIMEYGSSPYVGMAWENMATTLICYSTFTSTRDRSKEGLQDME